MEQNVEIQLDPEDSVTEALAVELIEDVRDEGSDGEVLATCDGIALIEGMSIVALIGLALSTATGIAILATFVQRVFRTGVSIDCRGEIIRIHKNKDIPRGGVLIIRSDGTTELREGLSEGALIGLLRNLLP